MNQRILAEEAMLLMMKDLNIKGELQLSDDPFEQLQEFLYPKVKHLLDHNFNGLLNAMYRVDIPENKLREILELSEPEQITHNITKAIIEREKQKVNTRKKYSF